MPGVILCAGGDPRHTPRLPWGTSWPCDIILSKAKYKFHYWLHVVEEKALCALKAKSISYILSIQSLLFTSLTCSTSQKRVQQQKAEVAI